MFHIWDYNVIITYMYPKFGTAGKEIRMKNKFAFTLAEVLITLTIIGVIASLTIPSVVSNSQQQEYKTGLKKAVSTLNQAITMNIAIEGESPYENANLFRYLQRHMNVIKSTTNIEFTSLMKYGGAWASNGEHHNYSFNNHAFYTTDGMRYEFLYADKLPIATGKPLYETNSWRYAAKLHQPGRCGAAGLIKNPNNTAQPPCIILVDVNGDRKPTPYNVNCKDGYRYGDPSTKANMCSGKSIYWVADPKGKKVYDIFSIMITDKEAIPYGTAAQKAMYGAQK